jgi:Reverse transcriptase (RNA-dependent DNA polymerase)
MSDKRQKNQLVLAFAERDRSEAPKASQEGTESLTAKCETERPARHEQLMEEVCERENCWQAYKRVKANKGSPGIDGMTVGELSGYLKQHWPSLREQLLRGTYQPQPVRRVEIPKPDGGVRKLGIPTVLDRLIQQAVMQVLQRRWDPTFSEHSHGFRPKRSAHQAVAKAQQYIAAGHRWVVDLDLEKFFDRVNHDKLMSAIARRMTDKRVLRLIGAFLRVGGAAGDEECHALPHATAQAQGKRGEERGGSTGNTEVPGVQLQQQQGAQATNLAEGFATLQAEDSGTNATDKRDQSRTDDEGACSLLKGLEELLRLLSDPLVAENSGSLDTASSAIHDLEAVETRTTAVREATSTRGW